MWLDRYVVSGFQMVHLIPFLWEYFEDLPISESTPLPEEISMSHLWWCDVSDADPYVDSLIASSVFIDEIPK
jgi:hypothetical protein